MIVIHEVVSMYLLRCKSRAPSHVILHVDMQIDVICAVMMYKEQLVSINL